MIMKKYPFYVTSLLIILLASSCSFIGDVFKAGMNFGIFIVLFCIVALIALIYKFVVK